MLEFTQELKQIKAFRRFSNEKAENIVKIFTNSGKNCSGIEQNNFFYFTDKKLKNPLRTVQTGLLKKKKKEAN